MKRVAPPELVSSTVNINLGEWTCQTCGEKLGAARSATPVGFVWTTELPDTCPTEDRCARLCVKLAESAIDPAVICLPAN